jgi:hypothetical protein
MLTVRLARQAGDTKLLFSYRVVGSMVVAQAMSEFSAQLRVGSEGALVGGWLPNAWSVLTPGGEMLTVAGQSMVISPVAKMEVPLPADATDQVLFIIDSNLRCAAPGAMGAGFLIDDLRLE